MSHQQDKKRQRDQVSSEEENCEETPLKRQKLDSNTE